MATLSELLARKAALVNEHTALEQQIVETRRVERGDAVAKVKSLMSEYGLTLADLGTRSPADAPRKSTTKAAKAAKPAKALKSGGKVPAKYRDTATGDAWSGRGLQPKWLKARLATGRTLAEFLI